MNHFSFVLNKFVLSFGLALMTFVSAYAADWGHRGVLIDGIYYMNNGDASVYVNFYDDSTVPSEVIIPETITVEGQNYTVESVRRLDSDKIVSVTLPSTVTSIGVAAFYGCGNLATVDLSNAKTTIGGGAFTSCENLVSVLNSDNVISIGDQAFWLCGKLGPISFRNSLTSIGNQSFFCCYSLSSISLGNSLEIIGDKAFMLAGLTSVEIPNTVKSIGEYAFFGCELMSSVVLPNSLDSIKYCTFYTSGIEEIIIPDGVKYIDDGAFGSCPNLHTVFIPKSVEQIVSGAFIGSAELSDFSIEEGNPAYLVEDGILYNAEKTRIFQGINAQMNSSYSFESSVETIDSFAFYRCDKLTSVVLPSSLNNISTGAFAYTTNLSSVVIPASVNNIYENAFAFCDKLISIVCFNPTPPGVYNYGFHEVPETCTVHVLKESVDKYKAHRAWAAFNIVGDAEDYNSIDKVSLENIVVSKTNGQIIIKGVSAGDVVTLYAASGAQLASVVTEDSSVCIDETIPSGTFIIVSINGRNKKFIF